MPDLKSQEIDGKYAYKYPMPAVTADIVLIEPRMTLAESPVLFIQRKNEPFKDMWALPGGFVNIDELPIDAAYRELEEETGIKLFRQLQFLKVMFAVNRDPRGRMYSFVYCAAVDANIYKPKAGDDAKKAEWIIATQLINAEKWPKLAFDHLEILGLVWDVFQQGSK